MAKKLFKLKEDAYDPNFIKIVACAIHLELVEPAELEYWQENGWKQFKIAKELRERVENR